MPKVKKPKLTPRQDKFIDKYLETGNGAKAAREAGYSERSAREMAVENLAKPIIEATLTERKDAAAKKAGFTLDFKYEMLKKAAQLALIPLNVDQAADIRGLVAVMDITNKMNGHYEAEKKDITTDVSNDGLKELIAQIKKDY